jgi:hypothetical protein
MDIIILVIETFSWSIMNKSKSNRKQLSGSVNGTRRELKIGDISTDIRREKIVSLKILVVFFAGAMIGELAPEPTDWIYFLVNQFGWDANPAVAVFTWYFLSATYYAIILMIAFIIYKTKKGNASTLLWITAALLVFSGIVSLRIALSDTSDAATTIFIIIVIVGLTLIGILYMAGYRVQVRYNTGKKGTSNRKGNNDSTINRNKKSSKKNQSRKK